MFNENPNENTIINKIMDANSILVTFSWRDPILRDASVNAIEVTDQRTAVRRANVSPNKIYTTFRKFK